MASIRLPRDRTNTLDTFRGQMATRFHQEQNVPELQEIDVLLGFQRMLDEEWNDVLQEVLQTSHPIRHPVSVINSNHATTEVRLECMENLHIALVLHDGEFRQHLKSRMGIDAHMKTPFTVHEACDPLRVQL